MKLFDRPSKTEESDFQKITGRFVDRRRWIYWARFESDDFSVRNSVSPFSQTRQSGKSVTNMMRANTFPPPYCLVTEGLMVLLDRDTTDEAVASFEHNVTGELRLNDKIFCEFPMSRVTARADLDSLVNRETNEPTDFVTAKLLKIDPFLYIPPLCFFEVVLVPSAGWVRPKFSGYVLLDGLTDLPVA